MSKEYAQHLQREHMSMYYEDQYDQWYNDYMSLPFKYMPNEAKLVNGEFTINVERMFDAFMRSMMLKQELDEVYSFGKGLADVLRAKQTDNGSLQTKAADFIETQLKMAVQGRRQKELSLFGRGLNRNWIKIIRTFKQLAAAPIMWLKPIAGTANGVFTSIYTAKEAVKGQIIKTHPGIPNEAVDFTVKDLARA